MTRWLSTTRRGLTFLELLLALTITAMVALAISGMMGAVTSGVSTRKDSRDVMVRAYAAQARIGGYIVPARCILGRTTTSLAIWLNDERTSDTVHASEIRWMIYDATEKTLNVHFVAFPDDWSETARRLSDKEYRKTADWDAVLANYDTAGHISSVTIVDGLEDCLAYIDNGQPQLASHAFFQATFTGDNGPVETSMSATLHRHSPPRR